MNSIFLTTDPIDPQTVLDAVRCNDAGGVVLFLGTVRETTDARKTESLDYEAYSPMARAKLSELVDDARARWSLLGCSVVHRTGHLAISEVSVAVATAAVHRVEAFEAARWLIDRIKQVVPIWKKDNSADGTSQWVHPGLEGGQE